MADALQTYTSDSIVFSMGGIPLEGMGDGTNVTIEYDGEGTTVKRGNDGSVARALSPSKTATVTVQLMQTASGNAVLYGFWAADQVSKGQGAVPLLIEDLSGGMLFSSAAAWVIKPAMQGFSEKVENREWKIQCAIADLAKFLTFATPGL